MANGKELVKLPARPIPARFFWAQILLALVVVLMVVAIALGAEKVLWDYAVHEASREHLAVLDRNAFLMEARLRGRANDMFLLKRMAEEELTHNPNGPPVGDNLRTAIQATMLARSQYDKISLLDLTGHEILRYNWKEGEHPL